MERISLSVMLGKVGVKIVSWNVEFGRDEFDSLVLKLSVGNVMFEVALYKA